jgi:putative two-component system response regulator
MSDVKQASILVVDDTVANLRLLQEMLSESGYDVRPCPNGAMALRAAASDPPDLVLLDINMPEMDGYEVCERLHASDTGATIPVIFISALNETHDKLEAFRRGGVDYITKPFQFEEVRARVETHLTIQRYREQLEAQNTHLEDMVEMKSREIIAAKEELSQAQLATIAAMCKIAEARDDDTGKHIERTQAYCRLLARKYLERGLRPDVVDEEFLANIDRSSPLHDIGKVAIPDAILCKPGKLTAEEFEQMKTHTVIGAANLGDVYKQYPNNEFLRTGIQIARSHHEKWDGSGYPDGLAGEDIPLAARIMAVADVYDALRNERCYKPPFEHQRARDVIVGDRGSHFDPEVVDIFMEVEEDFIAIHRLMGD